MPLDRPIDSTLFTAYVPRPDLAVYHGLKYLGENIAAAVDSAIGYLRGRKPAGSAPHQPRTDVANRRGSTSRETLKLLPQRMNRVPSGYRLVPADDPALRVDFLAYNAALGVCFQEDFNDIFLHFKSRDADAPELQDAFAVHTAGEHASAASHEFSLPASIARSQLVKGKNAFPSVLFDNRTGFAASISLRQPIRPDASQEVVIAFSGLGSQGGWWRQTLSSAANILGLTPTTSFKQAAELTRQVGEHIAAINIQRTAKNLPPLKVTVVGNSMGGAMATYAALKAPDNLKIKTVVFNPLRLGLLARADIGLEGMDKAKDKVTAYTVEGDFVQKYATTRSTPIGNAYFIPVSDGNMTLMERHNGFHMALIDFRASQQPAHQPAQAHMEQSPQSQPPTDNPRLRKLLGA